MARDLQRRGAREAENLCLITGRGGPAAEARGITSLRVVIVTLASTGVGVEPTVEAAFLRFRVRPE